MCVGGSHSLQQLSLLERPHFQGHRDFSGGASKAKAQGLDLTRDAFCRRGLSVQQLFKGGGPDYLSIEPHCCLRRSLGAPCGRWGDGFISQER